MIGKKKKVIDEKSNVESGQGKLTVACCRFMITTAPRILRGDTDRGL